MKVICLVLLGCAMLATSVSAADWTYDASTERLTDGSWTLNATLVSGSTTDLRLSSIAVFPEDTTVLDLSKPVSNGYKMTTIGINAALFYHRSADTISKIILPKTLTTVGDWSFEGCESEIILPDENTLSYCGVGSFKGANLTGRLVFDRAVELVPGEWRHGVFEGTKVQEVFYGKENTSLPQVTFHNCTSLTNFVSTAESLTIISWTIQNCTALRQYTFHCYPTLQNNWNANSKTGKEVRTYIKVSNSQWKAKIDANTFTAWENCTDGDKQIYFDTFGADAEIPIGYTSSPYGTWLMALSEDLTGYKLFVEGTPNRYGAPVPFYGDHSSFDESVVNCSVAQYFEDGDYLRECVGWELFEYDFDEQDWNAVESGDTISLERSTDSVKYEKLNWNWEMAGYKVAVRKILDTTSIVTNQAPLENGYALTGQTVSFTAVGEFTKWAGVLPEGVDCTQRTITIPVSSAVNIYPYCEKNWVYDAATSTVSDGYYRLKVSVLSDKELYITGLISYTDFGIADLSKPIEDGYTFVRLGNAFKQKDISVVKELILPSTLRTVDGWALQQTLADITVPEKNSLSYCGVGSFQNANLTGRLVFDNAVTLEPQLWTHGVIQNTKVQDVFYGKENTTLPGMALSGNASLTNFVSVAESLTIVAYSLQGCKALKQYTFHCYPTFQGNWNANAKTGTGVRTFVPLSNAQWKEKMAAGTFTAWENCSSGAKQTYFSTFGENAEIPRGYTTSPYGTWLLCFPDFKGTVIFVR